MALAMGGDESGHIGNRCVTAEDRRDGVDESAFAVCPAAMAKNKFMLARDACGGISAVALQKFLQLGVGNDAPQEGAPDWVWRAVGRRGAAGLLGDVVGRVRLSGNPGAQVDCRAIIL